MSTLFNPPSAADLAAKEAQLRSAIFGTQAVPFASAVPHEAPYGWTTRTPEAREPVRPDIPALRPEIQSIDLKGRRIVTSFGEFEVGQELLGGLTAAAYLVLREAFQQRLDEVIQTHGLAPLLAQVPTNAGTVAPAPASATVPAAPAPPAVPAGVILDEGDMIDPPSPDPKPVRKPRPKKG